MKALKLAGVLLVIPVLAFAVSLYYEVTIDLQLQSELRSVYPEVPESRILQVTTEEVLFHPETYGAVEFTPEVYLFVVMKYTSVGSALLGLLLIAAIVCLSLAAQKSRDWLARLFPWTAGGAAVAGAVATVVNGLLLVAALYYGEAALIGSVHYVIIGLAGIGALFGAVGIVTSLYAAFRPGTLEVNEEELSEDDPVLREVRTVAEALSAPMPDAVLLGDSPTFYAYQGPFTTPQSHRTGRLLYLSRDLTQRLDSSELRAILAHEFAHFLGKDLDYTMRFSFGYRALGAAVEKLAEVGDWTMALGRLPALYLLGFVLERFAKVERANSRERELEADRVAAETCGSREFAMGLTKVILFAPVLARARSRVTEEVPIAAAFEAVVSEQGESLWEDAASQRQAHPFDTHPSLAERLAPLKLEARELVEQVLAAPGLRVKNPLH